MMTHSTDIKILGGLPVTVEFEYYSYDNETGSGGTEDWWITHINSKKCKKPPQWLYNRIDKTEGEEDRIIEKCNNSVTYLDDNYE